MGLNFKDWLVITPEDKERVIKAALDQAGKPLRKPSAPSPTKPDLTEQWANFGLQVVSRLDAPEYQRLITYLLLSAEATASPAHMANIIRAYITLGRLPWKP